MTLCKKTQTIPKIINKFKHLVFEQNISWVMFFRLFSLRWFKILSCWVESITKLCTLQCRAQFTPLPLHFGFWLLWFLQQTIYASPFFNWHVKMPICFPFGCSWRLMVIDSSFLCHNGTRMYATNGVGLYLVGAFTWQQFPFELINWALNSANLFNWTSPWFSPLRRPLASENKLI